MKPYINQSDQSAHLDYKDRHFINSMLIIDNIRLIEKVNSLLTEAYREGIDEGIRQSMEQVDKIIAKSEIRGDKPCLLP